MKRLLLAALALALVTLAPGARAQTVPEGRFQLLVLPLTVDFADKDSLDGFDGTRFYQVLEQKAEQVSPQADLVIPSPTDPRLAGLDLSQEPDPATAVALGNKFGVPLVAWTKVDFRLENKLTQADADTLREQQTVQAGDPAPQNLVTVGGLAHLGLVDVGTGKVLVQGPVMVFRSGLTRANLGTGNFDDVVRDTTQQCTEDLATKVVEYARKQRPAPASTPAPAQ